MKSKLVKRTNKPRRAEDKKDQKVLASDKGQEDNGTNTVGGRHTIPSEVKPPSA